MASGDVPCKRPRLSVSEGSEDIKVESQNSFGNSDFRGSFENTLPRDISRWTETDIQRLSISTRYLEDVSPAELLAMFPLDNKKDKKVTDHFLWKYLDDIEYFFKHFCHFLHHLDGRMDTVRRNPTVNALRKRYLYSTKHFFEMEENSLKGAPEELKFWFQRFEVNGMKFGEMLYKIILKRDLFVKAERDTGTSDPICEYDFQFLFESFASMFGLNSSWSEPCIPSSTLQLSQAKICGKPDILFCWDIAPDAVGSLEEHLNIVAVCEVKKRLPCDSGQDSHSVTRSSESDVSSSVPSHLPPHLPGTSLGQHAGKLLIHYRNSIRKDVIFGIIVQETKVSFTALKMTCTEYHGIIAGKPATTTPQLLVTKPYDFLIKHERENLIRPLLELGMMQELKLK